jgi:thiosulfate/3-mercaptopyruvate sulfurtransferase
MRKSFSAWMGVLLLVSLLTLSPSARAAAQQESRQPFLVSTAWLAEHSNDSSLVLIQIGDQKEYERGHIPGAQFLPYMNISTLHGQGPTLELPPVEQLVSAFEAVGVSGHSHIVLCYAGERITPVGRTYFTLDYLGLGDHTSILDGGLDAWRAEKRPITQEMRTAEKGSFTAHPNSNLVVDAAWVRAHLHQPGTDILDARTPQFYSGADSGGLPRAGHIPGAIEITYASLLDDSMHFKDAAALAEVFRAAGVKPGDQVVTYCHIGQQASLVYFAARSLGYSAHLYDGSWEDWSARKDLPIETSVSK